MFPEYPKNPYFPLRSPANVSDYQLFPAILRRMITSKLTSKAQTTIPQAVRHHLGLAEGDLLGFVIEGERVMLCKPIAPSSATQVELFREWESEADERSFFGL